MHAKKAKQLKSRMPERMPGKMPGADDGTDEGARVVRIMDGCLAENGLGIARGAYQVL
jgi:hypothetical protein